MPSPANAAGATKPATRSRRKNKSGALRIATISRRSSIFTRPTRRSRSMLARVIIRTVRRIATRWLRVGGACLALLVLAASSTATHTSTSSPTPELPAEIALNEDAGRGEWLIIPLHLEGGEDLPFLVDTGAGGTLLDKSLESKLGKRFGRTTLERWDSREKINVYRAPKLFSGNTQLKTSRLVGAYDFNEISVGIGRRVFGCLGIDCLRHYCVQLDFEEHR